MHVCFYICTNEGGEEETEGMHCIHFMCAVILSIRNHPCPVTSLSKGSPVRVSYKCEGKVLLLMEMN